MVNILRVVVLSVLFAVTGCASIFSESHYPVEIKSYPSEANFRIINRSGHLVHEGVTPQVVVLEASSGYFEKEKYNIQVWKENHTKITSHLYATKDEWYWANALNIVGFFLGDPLTGAMWELEESHTTFLHEVIKEEPDHHHHHHTTTRYVPVTPRVTVRPVSVIDPCAKNCYDPDQQATRVEMDMSPNTKVTQTVIPLSKKTTVERTEQVQTVEEKEDIYYDDGCNKEEQPC
jgi:hypothetical protein